MIGTTLGQYHILAELGRGGMGAVYKARDTAHKRDVALKVLPADLSHDETLRKRFQREAQAASKLDHPNIIRILDVGEADGQPFIAMECLEGGSLLDWLQAGQPIDPAVAADITAQVAAGLDYAHDRGLVHRDIKPSNILFAHDGRAVLSDFGVVRASEMSRLTQTGAMMGTPEYMSPEQSRGEEVDARSDVYSLGVVLYQMLTGTIPFQADSPLVVLHKQVTEEPPPPRQINPKLPDSVEPVVLRALRKDPGERYPRAGELAADLAQAIPSLSGKELAKRKEHLSKVSAWYVQSRQALAAERWSQASRLAEKVLKGEPAHRGAQETLALVRQRQTRARPAPTPAKPRRQARGQAVPKAGLLLGVPILTLAVTLVCLLILVGAVVQGLNELGQSWILGGGGPGGRGPTPTPLFPAAVTTPGKADAVVAVDVHAGGDGEVVLGIRVPKEMQKDLSDSLAQIRLLSLVAPVRVTAWQERDLFHAVIVTSFTDLGQLAYLNQLAGSRPDLLPAYLPPRLFDTLSTRVEPAAGGKAVYIIEGTINAESGQQVTSLAEMECRLTLPGKLLSHNADELRGHVLVWRLREGQALVVQARSEVTGAVLVTPTPAPTMLNTPEATTSLQSTATPVPPAQAPSPMPSSTSIPTKAPATLTFAYGFCCHMYGVDMGATISKVKGAGFGWIKIQVPWKDLEGAPGQINWGPLDAVVDACAGSGVKLFMSVVKAPMWARPAFEDKGHDGMPENPDTFGNFIGALAARYRGRVAAYEVWNEQNLGTETGMKPSVDRYMPLLKVAYRRIKAADPNALVISGALTPVGYSDYVHAIDDVEFMKGMKDAGFKSYCDGVGVRVNGFDNPPWADPYGKIGASGFQGHPSFYFRRYEDLYKAFGGGKQLWITEAGWASMSNPPAGYEYAASITEDMQATYAVKAFETARSAGYIAGFMYWNLNYCEPIVPPGDEKAGFAVLGPGGIPRPAYDALAAMPK